MSISTVALIAGSLGLIVVIFSTVYSRRLRARGRRVPAAITGNVVMGWVLIAVTTVLLIAQAINSH